MLNWCWVNLQPNFQSYLTRIALACFTAYIFLVYAINRVGTFPCTVELNWQARSIFLVNHLFVCLRCISDMILKPGVCVFQSEKERWSQAIVQYHKQQKTLCGDVLITSAFVSYMGYFTRQYRVELLNNSWIPFLQSQKVRQVSQ